MWNLCCCPASLDHTPSFKCAESIARANTIPIFLVSGTAAVVLSKTLYDMSATGIHGNVHSFRKPWFMNAAMFFGMVFCVIGYEARRMAQRARSKKPKAVDGKVYLATATPALCDMLGTFLMNVGLLWVPASICQMFRGSIIVFTAILKVTYRKGNLLASEWIGTFIVVIALTIVGATTFWAKDDVKSSAAENRMLSVWMTMSLGISLVIFSQFLQALATVLEEKMLHDVEAPSVLVVGMEGLWGLALCVFVAMPLAQILHGEEGIHEDSFDTFVMLYNSVPILSIVVIFVLNSLLFNIYGMFITETTDAMVRNLMEPVRVLFIWLTELVLYQIDPRFGEKLTFWSLMELGGFVVLCFGFAIYYGVFKIPGLSYVREIEEKAPLISDVSSVGLNLPIIVEEPSEKC